MPDILKDFMLDTDFGACLTDRDGSPVGVTRLDVSAAHGGMAALLKSHINETDPLAWEKIRAKIDYMFENLDLALLPLDRETGFMREVRSGVGQGRKLFFKPNLVSIFCIEPQDHGADRGATACSEWSFVAALMRWFHDRLGILYSDMALGEAATTMASAAATYTMIHPGKRTVTTQAAIEGKLDDFYCGWGFYFARKYLKESLPGNADPKDDPMRGYEESLSGIYIPPGHTVDRLMVYDLNRIDDPDKGRDIVVPDGVFFKTITLHKAVVGGDPDDEADRRAYPGSVIINVPRLKVHNVTLLTAAIKNLGIGLYPMESNRTGNGWDYSMPRTGIPGIKGGVPHQSWQAETDKFGDPKRDAQGRYIVRKTGGIAAAMIDIIQAVRSQGNPMVHVIEAIEPTNLDHQSLLPGIREPEGLIFAACDPVAADLAAARYIFSNVGPKEARESGIGDGHGGFFPQRVPIPVLEEGRIVTREGYDSPIARDDVAKRAESRGLRRLKYYFVGKDAVTGRPLVSVQGRLGTANNGQFEALVTPKLYYDVFKFPWDLQRTFLKYLEASDRIEKVSARKSEFLAAFDENGDGVIGYDEFGRKGHTAVTLKLAGYLNSVSASEPLGHLKGLFISRALGLKYSDASWNESGHHVLRENYWGSIGFLAFRMSQSKSESPDPFVPGLIWGAGKWPCFQFARYMFLASNLYGPEYPRKAFLLSLFGFAFMYADKTQNEGKYSGVFRNKPKPGAIETYLADVANGKLPLDFTVYFPAGFERLAGAPVPNVCITNDPAKILTASFAGGKEVWAGIGN